MFSAEQGAGADLNGRPLKHSSPPDLQHSLLVTGFPYDAWDTPQDNFANFVRVSRMCQGVRRLGSAALDAAYVGAGRFDGFWELALNPWDIAAGGLVATPAALVKLMSNLGAVYEGRATGPLTATSVAQMIAPPAIGADLGHGGWFGLGLEVTPLGPNAGYAWHKGGNFAGTQTALFRYPDGTVIADVINLCPTGDADPDQTGLLGFPNDVRALIERTVFGPATITATAGLISGSTSLTVTAAVLQSLTITPANASVPSGLTQQYTATGNYSDGSTQNLTTSVNWDSSDTGAATISNTSGSQGLATAVAVGTTTISATLGALSGSTGLTVTPVALISIALTPADTTQPRNSSFQMTATGTYSNGLTGDVTTSATWVSSFPSKISVDDTTDKGLVSVGTQPNQTVTITATVGSVVGSTTVSSAN